MSTTKSATSEKSKNQDQVNI